MSEILSFSWVGSQIPHIDKASIARCGGVLIGCYGGVSGLGGGKNEDGALVWVEESGAWEFSVILDAHKSAESAELILRTITIEKEAIRTFLSEPVNEAFNDLQQHLVSRFLSPAFRTRCRFTKGETSFLICARKDRFLWWISIGDCQLCLFNPDLARLGQFGLSQRNFYEWVGRSNTFELPVACFSSGIRELRGGPNQIVLLTDGIYDKTHGLYKHPDDLFQEYNQQLTTPDKFVKSVLSHIHRGRGADSATIITWRHISFTPGLLAS
jgi:Protein phosphatase 2C